ncbi:MAG: iron-containing alcohol dehydrogenase [Clostridia bacterium]
MNVLQKIYYRAFQNIFKIAIPFMPYRSPRITETIEKIPIILREKDFNNVLIVTDKTVRRIDAFKKLENALKANQISYVIFDKTVPNPTIENVEDARALYIKSGCQALIGLGGGSSIDCAKAVGARIAKKKQPVQKMGGILKIRKSIPFLIAVPTTAGTGSEVTLASVITDEKTHHKVPINDFPLIPRVAVHDPETTATLPPHIVATTGMDALTHAVEAYIGNSTTKSTRRDAIFALQLICENLFEAYNNPENKSARVNMLYASFLAGRAFSTSYVGYCHAVAHTLGGEYGVPHGLANAVLLPYVLKGYGESVYKKLGELARAIKIVDKNASDKDGAEAFIKKIEEMNKTMNIPDKIEGIKEEDIPRLAHLAAKEANPLYPVPKLMDAKDLEKFYFDVKAV